MTPSRASPSVRALAKHQQGHMEAGLLSRERISVRGADAFRSAEGNIAGSAIASCWRTPRGRRPRASVEFSMRENREIPRLPDGWSPDGRSGKAEAARLR